MQTQNESEAVLASPDAEEQVLGVAFFNQDTIPIMRDKLTQGGDEFSLLKNGLIWKAILAVYERGDYVDEHTVGHELSLTNTLESVGGKNHLFWLGNQITTAHGAEAYADIVVRTCLKRDVFAAAGEMVNMARDPQITSIEIVTKARERVDKITQRLQVSGSIVDGDVLAGAAMDEFEYWIKNPAQIRGLSCGIGSIDNLIGGFQPGTVTGVLAATSMGKSTLTAGWVRNFAKAGEGLYVPTETPGKDALHKMVLDQAGIPFKLARTGMLTPQQVEAASIAYADMMATSHNIKIFDDSSPTMEAIEAKIMQMQAGRGCKWLVIDSGSKFAKSLSMAASGDNLYKATTMASGFMQDMARLGIVVVATWQVGRNMKDRKDGKGTGLEPTLHDAKESGSIEEDCDVLFGLYRHEYYVNRQMATADEMKYPKGTAKILLLKDRAGCDGDEGTSLGFSGGKGFGETDIDTKRVNATDHMDKKINQRAATRHAAPLHFGVPNEDEDDE